MTQNLNKYIYIDSLSKEKYRDPSESNKDLTPKFADAAPAVMVSSEGGAGEHHGSLLGLFYLHPPPPDHEKSSPFYKQKGESLISLFR